MEMKVMASIIICCKVISNDENDEITSKKLVKRIQLTPTIINYPDMM